MSAPGFTPGDMLVTAWASREGGPGWANWPIWVLVHDAAMRYRVVAIQPTEHSPDMKALLDVSRAASDSMTRAVRRYLMEPTP